MTYTVLLSPHAIRELKKIPVDQKAQIESGLDSLKHQPFKSSRIKKLQGRLKEYYRYRTGDYRIIYSVSSQDHKIYVDYIQHRREVYR